MIDELTKMPTNRESDRFIPWSADAREAAFEIWMLNGRPKLAELARLVTAETGTVIPYQTLRGWYVADAWDVEADRRLAQVAPVMVSRAALNVAVSAFNASTYLDNVWSGREPFDAKRHGAAVAMIAAIGFSPGSKARPALPAGTDEVPRTLRALSDAELRKLEMG